MIPADDAGNISVAAGTVLVFKNYSGQGNLAVQEIVFRAGADPLRIQINDNAMYPYIVPAGAQQGISGLAINTIKVLNSCTFAYDALA